MIKRIKQNLNIKVFLGIFLLLACSCAIIYSVVLVSLPDSFKTTKEEEIHRDMDIITQKINGVSYQRAKQILYSYANNNDYEIALLDGYGQVLFYSYTENETRSATLDPDSLLVSIVNEGSAVVYTNVYINDEVNPCVLYVYGYGETINSISHILFSYLPLIIAIIVCLAAVGAFVSARLITTPIRKLSIQSERMAVMEDEVHCGLNRNDELGVLSSNLDSMYKRLMETMYELEARSEELQIEIEKQKQAEQQRKDFFAAVSHELKTPITILKGELEGMIHQYGEYKDRDKYLLHTMEITNEIEKMVKEILLISKMNSDTVQRELHRTNLTDLLYDTYEQYIPLANQKQIDIICDAEDDVYANIDVPMFRKVISNLIVNAVNYSPEHAQVIITLEEKTLKVENTGVFIDEENLKKLFEPFYRVEQSRNRATGGTGLGLYIVKSILELHHMGYEMCNTNEGVLFTVFLV